MSGQSEAEVRLISAVVVHAQPCNIDLQYSNLLSSGTWGQERDEIRYQYIDTPTGWSKLWFLKQINNWSIDVVEVKGGDINIYYTSLFQFNLFH